MMRTAKPNDQTAIVFTRTKARRSGCKDQRVGDLRWPPLKAGGPVDVDFLEELPSLADDRFVASVDATGRYSIGLPSGAYTVTIEHTDGDLRFDGGSWLSYRTCREMPGIYQAGKSPQALDFDSDSR